MKKLKIISVGRLKTPFWRDAAEHYRQRLQRSCKLEEIEVRDGSAEPVETRNAQEAEKIIAALTPSDFLIALDERGDALSSKELASYLQHISEKGLVPCLAIGGAYGFSEELRQKAGRLLSFGPATLPHELARVVLLEQLFRADCILRGTGYHHE